MHNQSTRFVFATPKMNKQMNNQVNNLFHFSIFQIVQMIQIEPPASKTNSQKQKKPQKAA